MKKETEENNLEPDMCGGVVKPTTPPPPPANPNGYWSCIDEVWVWIENIGK